MKFSEIQFNKLEKSTSQKENHDIAIIGMAANIPFGETWEECWEELVKETDCMHPFPKQRQEDSNVFQKFMHWDREISKELEGGYLRNIDQFDAEFFKILPKEAELMDPNQRLYLKNVWEAIEDAGYAGERIQGTNTGIYLGYSGWPVYGQIISYFNPELLAMSTSGNVSSIIASRISHILDLRGPSLLVDTACSSSLAAVHLACQAIRNKECDMAIAGGIKLTFIPFLSRREQGVGIDSSDGKTKSFDEDSDGAGWGEGVISFLLKPLNRAIADKDNIHAVIKGSAMNQDGNSIGITAPNVLAQEEVIVKAWKDAGIEPETISYVETHGTGTRLGDPIETEALTKAFQRYTKKKQFCAIGSYKTNVGHLDCAAGAAGLLKAVLSLKYAKIPALLHFRRLNKAIEMESSPLYINDQMSDWETVQGVRRCGVSSFGLSGTNIHVILEEYRPDKAEAETQTEETGIFTISAKTRRSFIALVERYIAYFQSHKTNIADACYTVTTGRAHHDIRIAFTVSSKEELLRKLEAVRSGLEKEKKLMDIYEELDRGAEELCKRYINGEVSSFETWYRGKTRNKISLPVYRFDEKRYWFEPEDRSSLLMGMPVKKKEVGEETEKEKDTRSIADKVEDIWKNVLGFEEVDPDKSFAEMGGDSLTATIIASRIKSEVGIAVTISELLKQPSYKAVIQLLEGREEVSRNDIHKLAKAEYYETSAAQKRVYVVNEWDRNLIYNQPNAFILETELGVDKLEDILKSLLSRHEALRTSFHLVEGKLMQKIHDTVPFELQYEERIGLEKFDEVVKDFIKPFDLSHAPLIHVKLMKIGENRYFFIYDVHHIVADGWSINLLVEEFYKLINGEELKPIPIQYKDFAAWQNQYFESEQFAKEEAYWNQEFASPIVPVNWMLDRKRGETISYSADSFTMRIEEATGTQLKQFLSETKLTGFQFFLAAYSILIARLTSSEDVIVGTPVVGRNEEQLYQIMGMFVNSLAIRLAIDFNVSCSEFIQYVKTKSENAIENQNYQFDMLVEKLMNKRVKDRNPIFDTILVYDSEINWEGQMENEIVRFIPYGLERLHHQFDITLHIVPHGMEYDVEWIYSDALYNRSTIEAMHKYLISIMKEMMEQPQCKIGDLQIEDKENSSTKHEAKMLEAEFDF